MNDKIKNSNRNLHKAFSSTTQNKHETIFDKFLRYFSQTLDGKRKI